MTVLAATKTFGSCRDLFHDLRRSDNKVLSVVRLYIIPVSGNDERASEDSL